VRRAAGRARSWLERLRRARDLFPLTLAGLLAAGASLLAYFHYGRGRLDHILLAVGIIGVGLVGLAFVLVVVGAIVVWRAARAAPTADPVRAECGHLTATGFRLPSLRWLPFVQVRWSWTSPVAEVQAVRDGRLLLEQIRPSLRDHFASVERRIEIAEVFGFARVRFRVVQARGGRFAPWVGALQQVQVAHGLSGGDDHSHPDGSPTGDFYDMRRYGAGDPIRFILWKVFAKTRDLMVRTPEAAIAPDKRTLAYLVAGDGDEPAAGAARVAVDTGALGTQWILGADGCAEAASSPGEALEVLTRSRRAAPDDTGALASFLNRMKRGPVSRAVVFVPARPGPWMQRVTSAAAARPGHLPRVEFIVCTDGIGPSGRRSLWARAAAAPPESDALVAARQEDLVAVVDALAATGSNVLVVDRPGGRLVHGRSLRRAAA
jgi:hypothetical protein